MEVSAPISDILLPGIPRTSEEGVPRALLSDLHHRLTECLEAKFGRKIQRVDGESILAELKFPPKMKK